MRLRTVIEIIIVNIGWIKNSDHFAELLKMKTLEATEHEIGEGPSPAIVENNR